MIGFINTFLYNISYSQSITITHNQYSAETFFLDCRGLAPFSFSFYDSLLFYDWTSYTVSRRTLKNTSVAQQWIYENRIENTSSFAVIFTARCMATEVILLLPLCLLLRECVYRVLAQQRVYVSQYEKNIGP
jgi:hypothetical protein